MAIISPSKRRSIISEDAGLFKITIPARKNVFILIFFGFWLTIWVMGEVSVPVTFFNKTNTANLAFTSIWLVGWTIGGISVIYTCLWMMVGKEIVTIGGGFLSIKKDIFGLGKLSQYQMSDVKNLRIAPPFYNPYDFQSRRQLWGMGGGIIGFDYGAKTYRFAAGIDEAEAKEILEKILSRAPRLGSKD